MNRFFYLCVGAFLLSLPLMSGCLKTRSQLKKDSDDQTYPNPIQKVEPEGGYAFEEMRQELTRLTGRIEDIERTQREQRDQLQTVNEETLENLEDRIDGVEFNQTRILEAIENLQGSFATGDPIGLLQKARTLIKKKKLDDAVNTLGLYLKAKKAKHKEEALYLRGKAYYQLKKYKKAIVDLSQFPEKYNRSKYMPRALYRIGLSFDALGMKKDAQAFYQELVDRYPKSTQAKRARKKLLKSKKAS